MSDFLKNLKKAGLGDVEMAADSASLKGYLPTGNFALNWIISGRFFGGYPLGHVCEVAGENSSGKSYLVARAIAEVFKGAGVALLDDTESAFNAIWAEAQLGVDTSNLVKARSHTIEEHYEIVMKYAQVVADMKITDPSILALDSIALLSNDQEVENGLEKVSMSNAKVLKKHFRLTSRRMSDLNAVYLVTNHLIANIGDIYNPTTTGGGGGLKYQSSVRLQLRNPKRLKNAEGRFTGVRINCFVEKNRLVSPWRQSSMIIPFFEPISPLSGLIELLVDYKVLEPKGLKLSFGPRSPIRVGEETGVFGQKSDLWKQDQSALELIAKYPTLLKELDAGPDLAKLAAAIGTAMADET